MFTCKFKLDILWNNSDKIHTHCVIQLSPGGVLDEETIGRGLQNLGTTADGTQQVFLHLVIPVRMDLMIRNGHEILFSDYLFVNLQRTFDI